MSLGLLGALPAEQRRRDWQQAMAEAKGAFQEARQTAALDSQLAALDKADRVRAYCDALESTNVAPDPQRQA